VFDDNVYKGADEIKPPFSVIYNHRFRGTTTSVRKICYQPNNSGLTVLCGRMWRFGGTLWRNIYWLAEPNY